MHWCLNGSVDIVTVSEKKMMMGQQFGDTTLTKVFVGGLAWETQEEAMREHFDKYGEILEAVIIYDKATGRSKGYGFVSLYSLVYWTLMICSYITYLSLCLIVLFRIYDWMVISFYAQVVMAAKAFVSMVIKPNQL